MKNKIKVICFDADDTLWVNEPYFREIERKFCILLNDYMEPEHCQAELFKVEMQNLELYGYGVKGFMLSMIEAAVKFSNSKIPNDTISEIINLGKNLLDEPIELLDEVENALQSLQNDYRLIMATKGDLLDQERKLRKSKLESYFHHIEIMSDKKIYNYQKLLNHLDIAPDEFVMVGNSIKSDILPVLELGAYAVHVPYHTVWQHEHAEIDAARYKRFKTISKLSELKQIL
ncbi:MAG: HAD family hydrolase [Calditrichaeota bacterium]|nr:HAD family hydrolase [Calditrichota bacterium]